MLREVSGLLKVIQLDSGSSRIGILNILIHMRGTVYFSVLKDALSQARNYAFEIECFQSSSLRTVSLLIMELSGWKYICLVPTAVYRKSEVLVNAP